MATNKFIEEEILKKFQSDLISHFSEKCDISSVLASFAAEEVIGPNEVNRIESLGTPLEKVQTLLKYISDSLEAGEAGDTLPFYVMLKILEQYDGLKLAKQIWSMLSDHQGKEWLYTWHVCAVDVLYCSVCTTYRYVCIL